MATVAFDDPSVKGLHVGFEINEDPDLRTRGKQIVSGGGTTGEIWEWAGDGWERSGMIVTGLTPGSTTSGTGGELSDSAPLQLIRLLQMRLILPKLNSYVRSGTTIKQLTGL